MRVFVAMLVVAIAGCSTTHRSTLPPYVRELRLAREGGLEMISCGLILTVTENHGWYNNSTETDLKADQCWRVVIPTAVAQPTPQPVPPAVQR